jgi:hypothetical protein
MGGDDVSNQRLEEIKDLVKAAKDGDDAALRRFDGRLPEIILELIAAVESPSDTHSPPASGPSQIRSGNKKDAKSKPERKPRVVSQATAARTLGVSPASICAWLDMGRLTPQFVPATRPGKPMRRMVTAESVEKLLKKGAI